MDTFGFYRTFENININSIDSALGLVSRGFIDSNTRILVLSFNVVCRHLNTLTLVNVYFDLSNYDNVKVYQLVNIVNITPPDDLSNKSFFLIGVIVGAALVGLSLVELIVIREHYEMYWKHVQFAQFINVLGYFYFKVPTLFELMSFSSSDHFRFCHFGNYV